MQPRHLLDQVHRRMDVLNYIGMLVRALDEGIESLDEVTIVGVGEVIWMNGFDRFGDRKRIERGHCVVDFNENEVRSGLYMSTGVDIYGRQRSDLFSSHGNCGGLEQRM